MRRLFLSAIALAALASILFAASADADHPSPGKVSIHAWEEGFFGKVESSDPACDNHREIVVYRHEVAAGASGGTVVGTTTSREWHGAGQWSTSLWHRGEISAIHASAEATATAHCPAIVSPVVLNTPSDRAHTCGADTTAQECRLTILVKGPTCEIWAFGCGGQLVGSDCEGVEQRDSGLFEFYARHCPREWTLTGALTAHTAFYVVHTSVSKEFNYVSVMPPPNLKALGNAASEVWADISFGEMFIQTWLARAGRR